MKVLKIVIGGGVFLMGLLLILGHAGKNPDGSTLTFWQKTQDSFAAWFFLLIGAALLASARKHKDE